MKAFKLFPLALCATTVVGQNVFSSLLSEAGSVFTAVTSAIGNTNSATTSSSAATTSSSDSSTTSSSTTSSPTAAASSSLSSASSTTSSPSSTAANAAQSASSSPAASSSSGGSSNTLPIVLGCTLGALALASFLALLYLCLRRRKRSSAIKHRSLSPSDEEIDSWRHEKPRVISFKSPTERVHPIETSTYNTAPYMTEHPTGPHHDEQYLNPFAPVPPPARRSHSRAGLHGSAYYSTQPYSADDYHPQTYNTYAGVHDENKVHNNIPYAAAAGTALSGLTTHALNQHNRRRSLSRERELVYADQDPNLPRDEYNTLPQMSHRRSGSVGVASIKEPWPFMDAHERRSMDSARSRARSLNRSPEHFATPDQQPAHYPALPTVTVAGGAAALGGLAAGAGTRKSVSKSPHRKGILKQTISDSSDPISSSSGSRTLENYQSAADRRDTSSGPHELATTNYPPAPMTRERRNSALGSAAPSAAIGSYVNDPVPERYHHHQGISGNSASPPVPPLPITIPGTSQRDSIDSSSPAVPSRSPRRMSINPNARYSSAAEGTAEMPAYSTEKQIVSPPLQPRQSSEYDGVLSPISPINDSQNSSWSRGQAEELAMIRPGLGATEAGIRNLSQESTTIGSAGNLSDKSAEHSSGLVSAIQRIFSSQQPGASGEENLNDHGHYRTLPTNTNEYDHINAAPSMPHRQHLTNRSFSYENESNYGDADQTHINPENMPGSWQQPNVNPHNPATANQTRPQTRSRSHSRSRYTTILAPQPTTSYQQQYPQSTPSNSIYSTQPTLAALRHQVAEEDKARNQHRKHRSRGHSLSSDTLGRRHGDDSELFDLAMPGNEGPLYEREKFDPAADERLGAEKEQGKRRSGNHGGGGVRWAY